ncbi:MAG: hypothetical protein V4656_16585 [Pseudomonadota bacterium]
MPPPLGRPDHRPQVRYSPDLGKLICERIAGGQSEASLGREPGMPSVQAIYKWRNREPDFAQAYETARDQARRERLERDREEDAARRWRAALKPRKDGRGGSVSIFSDALGETICARVAGGETVLAIGADPDMPCASTIYHWVREDEDFREAYLRAKAVAADILADAALEIALESTAATVTADALRIRTIRWTAAMLAPKKYGARRALAPQEAMEHPPVALVFDQEEGADEPAAERDWWSEPG